MYGNTLKQFIYGKENQMALSDHEYVNFSEDYELNYHLRKVNKQVSVTNRATLRTMGAELKKILNKTFLTHAELHAYIKKQLHRLS
jgi:hypothetical protein